MKIYFLRKLERVLCVIKQKEVFFGLQSNLSKTYKNILTQKAAKVKKEKLNLLLKEMII